MLEKALENAMADAFHRPDKRSSNIFVLDVEPCKAFDFYGYKVGWSCFLKIRLLNPTHVYKCAELLLSGSITGSPLQPYESHIPYLLAFLADYNLYGCGWLEVDGIDRERLFSDSDRTAFEGREFDINVKRITNRRAVEQSDKHAKVFEYSEDSIAISSLSELKTNDERWRSKSGVSPWHSMHLRPNFQEEALNWLWERDEELAHQLKQRIEETSSRLVLNKDKFSNLMTAADLVPSGHPARFSEPPVMLPSPSMFSDTSPEEIHSQLSDVSQRVNSQLSAASVTATQSDNLIPSAKKAKREYTMIDQLSIGETDTSAVRDAADEASVILNSQFSSQDTSSTFFARIGSAFGNTNRSLVFKFESPSTVDVLNTVGFTNAMPPHYSNPEDVGFFPMSYGGDEFFVKSLEPKDLPAFAITSDLSFTRISAHILYEQGANTTEGVALRQASTSSTKTSRFELAKSSPPSGEVYDWLETNQNQRTRLVNSEGTSSYQFVSLEARDGYSDDMVVCALEVHVDTVAGKSPRPSQDSIAAVFWELSVKTPASTAKLDGFVNKGVISTIPVSTSELPSLVIVESEQQLLEEVVKMVRYFNPDILAGYEVNSGSWGYARERFRELHPDKLDNFFEELGRIRTPPAPPWKTTVSKSVLSTDDSEKVRGRHLLSLWNILRKEVSLSKYTLEYVVLHTLHERTPHFGFDELRAWWHSGDASALNSVARYWSRRVSLVLRLLSHFETVSRTEEKSRIIGVDFMSSLTRGSQFQVEAVLCRLARRDNYVLISPSKAQVGQQNALEYIPLVMEPMSEFYTDPVCVLDFRSLYPSLVIAFNLCYSTCIGRLNLWRGNNKLGIKQNHDLDPGILSAIGENNIYVAPNGIGYVSPRIRKSLLAQMLGEILETRFMVNDSRKHVKDNARFQRNLNNQQLALKFIANVTYGYTSASFSGRMPCAELADSIVLAGREMLQWCIRTIEGTSKWGIKPQVVYGDTDSLFVRLPHTSRSQAFRIGREIADMITGSTPDPVHLKLEKVYSPCILLTKKRYVGNAFENEDSVTPVFDAKGIETVRRDGTPIVQKIEKRALQILFATSDLSKVKQYLQQQWRRILNGQGRLQQFCFAQEVKLGHYKTTNGTSNLPGGAVVSLRKMQRDEGLEPQYRERVPFVVTAGAAGSRINDRVASPEDMMSDPSLKIDSDYYVQKTIIPPLERLFKLLGANVRDWYTQMPRTVRASGTGGALLGYLSSDTCACCHDNRRASPTDILCGSCRSQAPRSRYILTSRHAIEETKLAAAMATCNLCAGHIPSPSPSAHDQKSAADHACRSIDCPVYFDRARARTETHITIDLLDAF